MILRDGELVLRPSRPEDVEARMAIPASVEIMRMWGGSASDVRPCTRAEAEAWLGRMTGPGRVGWVIEVDGRLVGSAWLSGLEHVDRRAVYVVSILDEGLLGRGLGTRTTRLVLGYAFGELGLHRVGLRVIVYNARAIACYRRCGFVEEGREREAALVDGARYDDLLMGILARDFT